MEDTFPNTKLFDELEFLRFNDDQFTADAKTANADESEKLPLFSAVTDVSHPLRTPSSPALHMLTELKEAVASGAVGVYRSPEPEQNWFETAALQEKTLNALLAGASDGGALETCSTEPAGCEREAVVTSPVSFSAACKMSCAVEANPELLQSAEVSQTPAAETAEPATEQQKEPAEQQKEPAKRKLKVVQAPGGSGTRPPSPRRTRGSNSAGRTGKRKRTLSESSDDDDTRRFRRSKKVKRYEEAPFENPELERSRLNAINAKINRDRKKQELKELHERCDRLDGENRALSNANKDLEGRLRAAEEEIAFLRNIVTERLGSARPFLGRVALKSAPGESSARAGG